MVQDMLDNKVIQPFSSPWASPVVLVEKDGSFCFCVDYPRLNFVTKWMFPLSRIEDTLDLFIMENLQVFDCFRQVNLRLKPKKCKLASPQVQYLGYCVSKNGLPIPRRRLL